MVLTWAKRWSLTAVGLSAIGVIVIYSFLSTDSLWRTLVNTSSPIFLSVLVAAAGVGIGWYHDADFVASVALWAVVSATVGVAINQWYVFLLGGAFPDEPFYFTMSSVSVTAAFGTATGYYYTALRRKADELEEANRLLRDKNQRLDEFASIVSHDLRNPLNVARGQLAIGRQADDREKQEEHFDAVEEAHERMERLIREMLSFTREGEEVYEPEPVRLEEVANRAAANTPISESRVEVNAKEEIRADDGRLQTVFENLFRNAVEHCENGVTVEVGTSEDCVFYVEDDGEGIPPEKREQVFEGGYSTKNDGTGFGLPIVRRIAEVHGWSVRAVEGKRKGARFEFVDETER